MAEAFGVLKEKSMYGRTYMGIERSTFLIDEHGRITKEYRGVNATDHAITILEEL
jgi:peroxiredoxin Q/BCP